MNSSKSELRNEVGDEQIENTCKLKKKKLESSHAYQPRKNSEDML